MHRVFIFSLSLFLLIGPAAAQAVSPSVGTLLPREAKQGASTGKGNFYWCRSDHPGSAKVNDYHCTIYTADGKVVVDGNYRLFVVAGPGKFRLVEPGEPPQQAFDQGSLGYDSGDPGAIFLNSLVPEMVFLAERVNAYLADGSRMTFELHEGKLVRLINAGHASERLFAE